MQLTLARISVKINKLLLRFKQQLLFLLVLFQKGTLIVDNSFVSIIKQFSNEYKCFLNFISLASYDMIDFMYVTLLFSSVTVILDKNKT